MLQVPTLHACVAVGTVLALAAGVQTWRLHSEKGDHAQTIAVHAAERAALQAAALAATTAARATEQRRTAAAQEAANHAHAQLNQARADAGHAAAAGERLRQRLAALAAGGRCPASDSAAAAGSPPADATADLLADVQRGLDAATEQIAVFADAAHTAGTACERIHGALTAP